jgi:outer membrane lipoprotein SlyB
MKSIRILLAAAIAFGLGGCAADGYSNPFSNTTPAASQTPYVVDSYQSSKSGCQNCGTVQSVNQRQIAGKPNVVGALVGAIVGGVAGNQFGSGRGNTAATAGGAIAGGVVGSQIAKGESSTVYDMNIRMDNGENRTLTVASAGGLRAGSRVRISGDHVTPM